MRGPHNFWRLVRTPPDRRNEQAIARHLEATAARFELLDRMPMPGRTWTLALQLTEGM